MHGNSRTYFNAFNNGYHYFPASCSIQKIHYGDQSESPFAKYAILQVGLSLWYETMASLTNGVCGCEVKAFRR
jgi:hypothetical protein